MPTDIQSQSVKQPRPKKSPRSGAQATPPETGLDTDAILAAIDKRFTAVVDLLPDIVDRIVQTRLTQIGALNQNGNDQAQLRAAATADHGRPGGRLGMQDLLDIVQKLGIGQQQPAPNSLQAVVAAIDGLGSIVGAIDKIRGINQPGQPVQALSPKMALEWAKWGYSVAKKGDPEPGFDQIKSHVPPADKI